VQITLGAAIGDTDGRRVAALGEHAVFPPAARTAHLARAIVSQDTVLGLAEFAPVWMGTVREVEDGRAVRGWRALRRPAMIN
jgi:hypothetical protein